MPVIYHRELHAGIEYTNLEKPNYIIRYARVPVWEFLVLTALVTVALVVSPLAFPVLWLIWKE